jgi:protein TonB
MISHRLIVTAAGLAALAVSLLPLTPEGSSRVIAGTPPAAEKPAVPEISAGAKVRLAGKDGVTRPVLIEESKVKPAYPEAARKERIMGKVILQAVVDRTGRVGKVEVLNLEPKDYKAFADNAVKAVSQWRYEPATANGVPVDVYFTIRIEYKLDSEGPPGEKGPGESDGPIT